MKFGAYISISCLRQHSSLHPQSLQRALMNYCARPENVLGISLLARELQQTSPSFSTRNKNRSAGIGTADVLLGPLGPSADNMPSLLRLALSTLPTFITKAMKALLTNFMYRAAALISFAMPPFLHRPFLDAGVISQPEQKRDQ